MHIPSGDYQITVLFSPKANELQMGNVTVIAKLWKIT
jgi:hypothetical protein